MPAAPIHRYNNPPSNPFGPAPSSNEIQIPRPKSSSSLPYARPPNPMQNGSASQQHPIMVALSGWPEPVYVAESKEVARRRSRAGTPVMAPLTTGMGDGVDLNMLPPLSGGRASYREERRDEGSPYPLSSARSTRTSPTRSGPNSPTPSHSYPNPPLSKGYYDPRYGPGAALNNRALRVVPAWSSSSSPTRKHENLGVGIRVPAGHRSEGCMVMRAVPDVYPPPGMVMAGGGGLAKEVYPRDPNNVLLWGGAVPVEAMAAEIAHPLNTNASDQSESVVKVEMEDENMKEEHMKDEDMKEEDMRD